MVLVESIWARSREVPRIQIRRPVALVTDDGYVATAVTRDLSPGGMQIRCDRANAYALNPAGDFSVQPVPSRIDAHFTLPLTAGLAKIDVECRMVYFNELRMEYLIGFVFSHFKDYSFLKLDRFIQETT
ncbi:MAG: PilZ domain-containing protein [Gammaproteobacteria bacterium]|jgi:c-di-GMP-binding flagellar brake protein YcgR